MDMNSLTQKSQEALTRPRASRSRPVRSNGRGASPARTACSRRRGWFPDCCRQRVLTWKRVRADVEAEIARKPSVSGSSPQTVRCT